MLGWACSPWEDAPERPGFPMCFRTNLGIVALARQYIYLGTYMSAGAMACRDRNIL